MVVDVHDEIAASRSIGVNRAPQRSDVWRTAIDSTRLLTAPATIGVIAAVLSMWRVAAGNAINLIWADDSIFLHDASYDGVRSIFDTHAGYIHIVPRFVALLALPVPIEAAPVAYVIAASALTGFVAAYVTAVSRAMLPDRWCRACLGLTVVLVPIAGFESMGSPSNAQWWLLIGATFAIFGHSVSRRERAAGLALLAAVALSSPPAIALLPFTLVRWRDDRRIAYTLGAALAVQFAAMGLLGRADERNEPTKQRNIAAAVMHFFDYALNGATSNIPTATVLSTTVVLLIVIGVGVAVDRSTTRDVALVGGASFAIWLACFLPGGLMPRYAIVPAVMAVAAGLIATRGHQVASRITAGILIAVMASSFAVAPFRATGPRWTESVDDAECVDGAMDLPVSPQDWGTLTLPCDD